MRSPAAALTAFFARLHDLASARPAWTLVFTALVLAWSLVQLRHLPIELDIYEREVEGFPATHDHQELRRRFKDSNSVVLFFVPASAEQSFTERDACKIREWLRQQQLNNVDVTSVASAFGLRQARREGASIWYRPLLDFRCDETGGDADRALDLSALADTPWKDTLKSRGLTDLSAELVFRDTPGGSRFGRFDPAPVKKLFSDAQRDIASAIPGARVYMVGPSAFQAHLKDALLRDLALQSLVFVVIFLMFRWVLGTWRSGFLFLGTLALNLIFLYGVMAAAGQPLDILTNNLALMTTIAGIEDFIFVSMFLKRSGGDAREAFRRMIAPCFFTTLTTVIGFLSLKTSNVEIIGRFGVWAGLGAFAEWWVMFLVLPSLLAYLPPLRDWIARDRVGAATWLTRVANLKAPRWAGVASAVFFVAGIAGFRLLEINERPARNFPSDHPNTISYDYVRESRGWETAVPLLFEANDIADQREQVRAKLAEIARDPNVAGVLDPFSMEEFVAAKLEPRDRSVVRGEIRQTPAYKRLFSSRDQARAVVYLRVADLESLDRFVKRLKQICPDGYCRAVGQTAVYLEFSEKIVPTLLESFSASVGLVIVVILALAYWLGVGRGLKLAYSAAWGPVAMMGFIALFRIPVSLITSLFAATIVGLTGDNGIQYVFAGSERGDLKSGLEERAEASIFLGLMLAMCSLVFLAESVRPMKILGVLFFTGFIVTLAGDLWLLKGLLEEKNKGAADLPTAPHSDRE